MTTPLDEFIGWMTNQKETTVTPEPEPAQTPLERAKELRLKHLQGQHNQDTHGHGGSGFDASSFVDEVTKLPVSDRITRMKKLSPAEREAVTAEMGKRSGNQYISTPKKPQKVTLRREREPYAKSGYVWRSYTEDGPLNITHENKNELMRLIQQNQPVSEFVEG